MKYSLFLFIILIIDFIVILFKIKHANAGHSQNETPLLASNNFSGTGASTLQTANEGERKSIIFTENEPLVLINVNRPTGQYTSWPQDLV